MKVLHLISSVSPQTGGSAAAVIGMASLLQKNEVDVEIATSAPFPEEKTLHPLGKKTTYEGLPAWFFDSPYFTKYGFSWKLTQWLKEHLPRFDLLHLHGLFAYPTVVAGLLAHRMKIPYVLKTCGELDAWSLEQNAFLKNFFLKIIGRKILNRAAAIHVTSVFEERAILELSVRTRVEVIPNGIYLPFSSVSQGKFRVRYPEIGEKKLILFVSRLDPKKGLNLLFKAASQLKRTFPNFILAIGGNGSPSFEQKLRREIRSLQLSDHVIFCGFLNPHAKQEAFEDADLFVLPSYDENFGIAPLEAMGAGVPVILSDKTGISEDVRQHAAGLIVPCEPEPLEGAMKSLLTDEKLRTRLGENGRNLVKEKFVWDLLAKNFIDLYTSILSSSSLLKGESFSYEKERIFYSRPVKERPFTKDKARLYLRSWLNLQEEFTGKQVLEIGAGPSIYAQLFAEEGRAKQVVAMDLFKERFGDLPTHNTLSNLIFVVGDCLKLPFPDQSFDVVFGSLILHRFHKLEEVIKEIKRILKKQGIYFGIEPSLRNPAHLYRYFFSHHSPNEFLLKASQISLEFNQQGFQTHLAKLAPRYPFMLRIGLSTCVGIRAQKVD